MQPEIAPELAGRRVSLWAREQPRRIIFYHLLRDLTRQTPNVLAGGHWDLSVMPEVKPAAPP